MPGNAKPAVTVISNPYLFMACHKVSESKMAMHCHCTGSMAQGKACNSSEPYVLIFLECHQFMQHSQAVSAELFAAKHSSLDWFSTQPLSCNCRVARWNAGAV